METNSNANVREAEMDSFIPLEKLPYPCLKQVKSDRYFLKKTFCWKLGVLPSSGFLSPFPGRPAEPEAGKQVLQRVGSGHPQEQKHGEQGTEGRYLYIPENKYACETCYIQASRSLLRHLKNDFVSASMLTMHMDQSTRERLDFGLEPVRGSRDLLHDEHEIRRVYYHMDTKAKVNKN